MNLVTQVSLGLQPPANFCTQAMNNVHEDTTSCAKRVLDIAQNSLSTPETNRLEKQLNTNTGIEAKLETLSGVCWDCIERERDTTGGWLYKFKYKVAPEQFPAVEPSLYGIGWLKSLESLGYKAFKIDREGTFLVLPDLEVLEKRWGLLRQADPSLPKLNFLSSEGILDHEDFIKAWMEFDIIISRDKEFVHDQTIHAYMIFDLILKNPLIYREYKEEFKKRIHTRYEKVKSIRDGKLTKNTTLTLKENAFLKLHTEILLCIISAIVDAYSAYLDGYDKESEEKLLVSLLENKKWLNYLTNNYGHDELFYQELWEMFSRDILKEEEKATNSKLETELKRWDQEVEGIAKDEVKNYLLMESHAIKQTFIKWLQELSMTKQFHENPAGTASKAYAIIRTAKLTGAIPLFKSNPIRKKGCNIETEFDEMYRKHQEKSLQSQRSIKPEEEIILLRSIALQRGLESYLLSKSVCDNRPSIIVTCMATLNQSFALDLAITSPTFHHWPEVDMDALQIKCIEALREFNQNVAEYVKLRQELDSRSDPSYKMHDQIKQLRKKLEKVNLTP